MYFVYLLICKDGSIYTGITTDVERRFKEHKSGIGSSYTRSRGVVRIAYSELHKDRVQALRREAEIKKWPKSKKIKLIGEPRLTKS